MNPKTAILALLRARADGSTVCPSGVARLLAAKDAAQGGDWRGRMADVHAAVDQMVANETIGLSWKGVPLVSRNGPYRIRRGPGFG